MTTAQEMRKISEKGILQNIRSLIEHEAEKGRVSVNLGEYDGLYMTDSMREELEKDGFEIKGNEISW